MSGFSFPPPPPPPPQAAQPQRSHQNRGQAHGRGSFRGGREQRGRGRGRGNDFSSRDHQNSNTLQRPHFAQRGNRQNGHHHNEPNTVANQSWSNVQQPQPGIQPQALPPGAFINPNFAHSEANSNVNQYNIHQPSRNDTSLLRESQNLQHRDQGQFLPRTAAGHKRKLEALRPPSREKKPPPPTAPSIPGFGAHVIPPKPTFPASPLRGREASPSKSKSTGRSLGLIPQAEDARYSPSGSEDDEREVDEEAAYAEIGDKLTFEHNGVLMSLNSQADLAAWKKERQKNWPTRERTVEKERQRQRVGEERKRLLAGATLLWNSGRGADTALKKKGKGSSNAISSNNGNVGEASLGDSKTHEKQETKLEKAKREVAERTKQLENLRRKVAESETRNREARARQELNNQNSTVGGPGPEELNKHETTLSTSDGGALDIKQEGQLDDADEEPSEASENSSLESSSEVSSDSSSEAESEDAQPEETTSKQPTDNVAGTETRVCKYFAASGYCRDGDACRFKHERRPEGLISVPPQSQAFQKPQQRFKTSPNATTELDVQKKGIFERLMEQEQDEEDKLALKVIKYLGSVGFFQARSPAESGQETGELMR